VIPDLPKDGTVSPRRVRLNFNSEIEDSSSCSSQLVEIVAVSDRITALIDGRVALSDSVNAVTRAISSPPLLEKRQCRKFQKALGQFSEY